ncbi:hypothetical protein CKAH01_10260 [Colletotrichum kahawae]|uniref:Uncharacterized protein n=1 Tax=Colletotrichum kahawae TaxID=34407 RepID=A0AAD9XXJ1_COLKA|nr:hypothetical protein CKAH01_10260 [Colletotrichum kahawae]
MGIFFVNNKWHEAAVKVGANPIFFGSDLKRLALGEDCRKLYVAAASMDWSGDFQYKAQLAQSLKGPRYDIGNALSRIQGADVRFTLNIQEDSDTMDDHTKVQDFASLFNQESDELTTCVLYYNKGQGHLEEFYILGHKLPWKSLYRIPLQYSLSAESGKSLEWAVAQDVSI